MPLLLQEYFGGNYGTKKDYRLYESINKGTERGQAENSIVKNGSARKTYLYG